MSNKKEFKKFSMYPESVGSIASVNTGGKINPEQHFESEREKVLEFWNDLVKRTASIRSQGEEIVDFILERDKEKEKSFESIEDSLCDTIDDRNIQVFELKQEIERLKLKHLQEREKFKVDADKALLLVKENETLKAEIERLKEAMQEFIARVEKGEVRSIYSYNKFKELLK